MQVLRMPPAAIRPFAESAAARTSHETGIFDYTSGRWLYNEQRRLDERRLTFNVSALLTAAAESVNRQKEDIKSFCKLGEGGFNRVFEMTMHDGLRIIARLPYPSTQPKFLATSSEVATMDLVRRHSVPTPLVYAYSADANNPVGSEYIVMERIPGRSLTDIWYELCDKERVKILGKIVDQEAKLFKIPLPAYGSIYKTSDLPNNVDHAGLEADAGQFCVGPDASLEYWFGTRSQLDVSRSPGKECTRSTLEYCEMFNYEKVNPDEHIRTLEKFVQVAAHTVPAEEWLRKPVIRHPDLSPNNIFVDDDCRTGLSSLRAALTATKRPHLVQSLSLQQHADETMEKMLEQEDIDKKMGILRDAIGINTDGWVAFERYDAAVAAAKHIKAEALSYAENELDREMIEQHWPFDDFDEDGLC
ncbi:hypothetical protein D0864_02394 [Hortaea werneckii]|uniref:Protein kinase domain-containing protein n=1 Tax=Hortaea werneckii TaxID=91943 RepID=A0A3M7GYP3_HORWE|nr:hypothetical protein D0864_02394 [Hortaea werneckii]